MDSLATASSGQRWRVMPVGRIKKDGEDAIQAGRELGRLDSLARPRGGQAGVVEPSVALTRRQAVGGYWLRSATSQAQVGGTKAACLSRYLITPLLVPISRLSLLDSGHLSKALLVFRLAQVVCLLEGTQAPPPTPCPLKHSSWTEPRTDRHMRLGLYTVGGWDGEVEAASLLTP